MGTEYSVERLISAGTVTTPYKRHGNDHDAQFAMHALPVLAMASKLCLNLRGHRGPGFPLRTVVDSASHKSPATAVHDATPTSAHGYGWCLSTHAQRNSSASCEAS